jgi:hypothetical protein
MADGFCYRHPNTLKTGSLRKWRGGVVKFFRLVQSGIDVAPLLAEIQSHEHAWLANTSRQDNIQAQRDTNTIFICSRGLYDALRQ